MRALGSSVVPMAPILTFSHSHGLNACSNVPRTATYLCCLFAPWNCSPFPLRKEGDEMMDTVLSHLLTLTANSSHSIISALCILEEYAHSSQ